MFQYKPGFIPSSFVIIGAGGTGGRLVPLLAQFIKTVNWVQNTKIYVVDHDHVEEKNLIRQNFIKLDLGKPKAVVLADRYSKAFDANIIPVVAKVNDILKDGRDFHLEDLNLPEFGKQRLTLGSLKNAIVVMCVDSVAARIAILNQLFRNHSASKNLFIIDSGNGNDFGQVMIYNDAVFAETGYFPKATVLKLPYETPHGSLIPFDVEMPIIPFPLSFYESMKDGEERNCAELDQTLAINASMATTIMGIIQNFVYVNKRISFHKLNIDLLHGVVAEYITFKYLVEAIYSQKGGVIKPNVVLVPRPIDSTRVIEFINRDMRKFKDGQQASQEKSSQKDVKEKVTSPTAI